jgi:hypothetical protein
LYDLDGTGHLLWRKVYGGTGIAQAVTPGIGGGYMIAGTIDPSKVGSWDVMMMKVDEAGTFRGSSGFGLGDRDDATAIRALANGQYLVTSTTSRATSTSAVLWLCDSTGQARGNQQIFGTNESRKMLAIAPAVGSGRYMLAGSIWPVSDSSVSQIYLLLSDSLARRWATTRFGPVTEYRTATAIASLDDGGYVIGGTVGPAASRRLLLMRLGAESTSGVDELRALPAEFDLSDLLHGGEVAIHPASSGSSPIPHLRGVSLPVLSTPSLLCERSPSKVLLFP